MGCCAGKTQKEEEAYFYRRHGCICWPRCLTLFIVLFGQLLQHLWACLFQDCPLNVFSVSYPQLSSKGRCLWNRQAVAEGCLLGGGGWEMNRVLLCVPAEVGSVCQDQNTQASVLLPLASHTPPVHVYPPTQPKLFVSAALSRCSLLVPPHPWALIPPNKHCTGNCRDIWDFWGDRVERSKG